jgi:purine nucleosidase
LHPCFDNMDRTLVYVDTDVSLGTPGAEIDDGAALILLLRHPAVEVIGAGAVFGNAPLADTALNLDRLLTWLGGEAVPRGIGAARPLVADMSWFDEWRSGYGATLFWAQQPTSLPAALLLIETLRTHPGQVSVLALGPLTNLALALRLAPDIVPLVRRVIAMGGSFNTTHPVPEFNVRCDPEAAQVVLTSGWPVQLLGLEITRRVHFSRDDLASLAGDHPAVGLLRDQAPDWIDRVERMGWEQGGCALHDAVAAACLIAPDLFTFVETAVEVELANPQTRGQTRFTPAAHHPALQAATGLDAAKIHDLIWIYLKG